MYIEDSNSYEDQAHSINDLLELREDQLGQMIFSIKENSNQINQEQQEQEQDPLSQKFYRLKIENIKIEQKLIQVLKIIDITINIRLQKSQQQKKILQMVNACVSHEMRNPINSIFAMNMQLRDQASELGKSLAALTELARNKEVKPD